MQKTIDGRELWSKYGIWIALFAVLYRREVLFNISVDYPLLDAARSLSLTCSVAYAAQCASRPFGLTRCYFPYVVKWLSWFVANCVGSFLFFVLIFAWSIGLLFGAGAGYAVIPLLGLLIVAYPIVRFCTHVRDDLAVLRRAIERLSVP